MRRLARERRCSLCPQPATLRCRVCGLRVCTDCLQKHMQMHQIKIRL